MAPSRDADRSGDDDATPLFSERAAASARAELRGDRAGILGAVGISLPAAPRRVRSVPDRWSLIHVMDRMEEGFRTLARLPMPTRPRGYVNSMPVYLYDRGDLNAQLETHELDRMAKLRNRVRILPSPTEIAPKIFRLCFPTEPIKRHRTEGYFSLQNESEIWLAGLDDQERAEKILGKEYATIFLNECSQIPYSSVLVALTRLAQVVEGLPQAAFYDLNPTGKGHWTNVLFGEKRDPVSRQPLDDPENYQRMFLNPRDNEANLSKDYLKSLERLPERQRKRFFDGAYVDDLDGALFSYERIARARVAELPLERRRRIVVAVDPSGAAGRDDAGADEIGIVVAARGDDGHAYVLADRSLRDAPAAWGRVAVQAYHDFQADVILAEENFGGEMVRFVIRAADANAPVRVISASRGKALRAEPISALYEQGLVHHVGRLTALEDQLCAFTTAGYRGEGSPDHADALVFAVTELMLKDNAPILEFYRRQAEDRQRDETKTAAPPPRAEALVRLRAAGSSIVHGLSGTYYMADAEGIFAVTEADAAVLTGFGFERIAEEDTSS